MNDMELTKNQEEEFSLRTKNLREHDINAYLTIVRDVCVKIDEGLNPNEIFTLIKNYAPLRNIALLAESPAFSKQSQLLEKLLLEKFNLTHDHLDACIKIKNTLERDVKKGNDQATLFKKPQKSVSITEDKIAKLLFSSSSTLKNKPH
jgi:hypothetical protein